MKKKILSTILLGICTFLLSSCVHILPGEVVDIDDYFFMNKLDISDHMAAHFTYSEFKNLDYISDDLLVYHYTHATTNDFNQVSIDNRFKVVTNTDEQTISVGLANISTYIGYDQEQKTIYFLNPNSYPYQIETDGSSANDELDFRPPVSFMTTSYFGSITGVYDFLGNSYQRDLFSEQIISFKYNIGDDVIYFSYVYGKGDIYGYNLTQDTTMDVITLKDDLKLRSFIYADSNYAIIELKLGGFISINKEGEINYFLRNEHIIDGYNGLNQDTNLYDYPYLEYEQIDGNNTLHIVSNLSLSTFITVDDGIEVSYLDENTYVLLDEDTYYFYINDEIVHMVDKTDSPNKLYFRRYKDKLIYRNYSNQTTDIFDINEQQVIETLNGTIYFHNNNIYAYIPIDKENQIVIYDIDNKSEKSINIRDLSEKNLFYINNEYFIIYDDTEVTLYDTDTLDSITFKYISELSRPTSYSTSYSIIYGLLVEYNHEYYLIG